MQFERIRKSHKRKIIIGGLILVCVISAITITTTRAKYKITQDIPLARGTVNYNPDKTKPVITNVTTSVTKTEINVTVSASDNVGVTEYWYQLDSNAAVKGTGNTYKFTGLAAGSTHTVKVYVKDAAGNQSDTTINRVQTTAPYGSETILGNITVNSGSPNFANAATTDEGVYKVSDGMYGGYSYYWRGAVTNNYVKFGGFCWRIIRINGDGSMRLIYDGATCHANGTSTTDSLAITSQAYNPNYDRSEYVGYTYTTGSQRTLSGIPSNAKTQLESWYNSNLASYAERIVNGKYCNDRNVGAKYSGWSETWATTWSTTGTQFAYAGADRLLNKHQPTLSCSKGDVYTLKIGLVTADEAMYAGGKVANNTSYYLYNGQNYWTMSPINWSGFASMFYVYNEGHLGVSGVQGILGLRPVINLKADVTFSGGNGTLDNPYVVI
ncbi:MAG: hypothetical protein HFI49_03215 [Bacilli bacterium]|jgi:hypothetical protein|nr:hypothetical protein [Bacilli bacterium]